MSGEHEQEERRCLICGAPLPARVSPGPPRKYCSGACHDRASKARMKQRQRADGGRAPSPRIGNTSKRGQKSVGQGAAYLAHYPLADIARLWFWSATDGRAYQVGDAPAGVFGVWITPAIEEAIPPGHPKVRAELRALAQAMGNDEKETAMSRWYVLEEVLRWGERRKCDLARLRLFREEKEARNHVEENLSTPI